MRKLYIQVVSRLVVTVEEGVSLSEIMDTMALDTNDSELVQIEETTIEDYEILDSK
jgi:hypothetical protein